MYRVRRIKDNLVYDQDQERKKERRNNRKAMWLKILSFSFGPIYGWQQASTNSMFLIIASLTCLFTATFFHGWLAICILAIPFVPATTFWLVRRAAMKAYDLIKMWDRIYDWFNHENSGLE
jgi:fatty acid desaturase